MARSSRMNEVRLTPSCLAMARLLSPSLRSCFISKADSGVGSASSSRAPPISLQEGLSDAHYAHIFRGSVRIPLTSKTVLDRAVKIASLPLKLLQNENADVLGRKTQLASLGGLKVNRCGTRNPPHERGNYGPDHYLAQILVLTA